MMQHSLPEKLTNQSGKASGQRFYAFVLVCAVVNFTLWMATKIGSPIDLSSTVIYMEAGVGVVLILGRTGVHMVEAWARSKGVAVPERPAEAKAPQP